MAEDTYWEFDKMFYLLRAKSWMHSPLEAVDGFPYNAVSLFGETRVCVNTT